MVKKVIKISPEDRVVDKAVEEIRDLAGSLDTANTDKLSSDLWDLESKASALRSFILNRVIRKA